MAAHAGGFVVDLKIDEERLRLIQSALELLPAKVRKRVVADAIKKGLLTVAAEASARLPVDVGTAAGALTIRRAKGRRGGVRYVVAFKTAAIRKASGNDFFYPAVIEYGSEKLNREPVAPMRGAYEATADAVARQAEADILAGVDAEIRGASQ